MIGDRELLAFRRGYYELFVTLLCKEPSTDQLLGLSNGLRERIEASYNLHPLLGAGWEEVSRFLKATPAERLAELVTDEYLRLFIGPHGPELNPYESFYFAGRLMDRPLANLRSHLKQLGLEKQEGYPEPEDFLAYELEVMRWLIGKQDSFTNPEEEKRWLQHQAQFLKQHLLVWGPACAQDIESAKGAVFYRGIAMTLRGFLELERTLFLEWGLDKITPLEEVRRLYGAVPMWRGPTFDYTGEAPKTGAPSREK